MTETSNENVLRFNTGDEIVKVIALIAGWYIALFHGVFIQVTEAKPVVRAVIGILLMLLITSNIPNRSLKRETDSQNLVYWLEVILFILTGIFGMIMFGASMEEMGYPMEDPYL